MHRRQIRKLLQTHREERDSQCTVLELPKRVKTALQDSVGSAYHMDVPEEALTPQSQEERGEKSEPSTYLHH